MKGEVSENKESSLKSIVAAILANVAVAIVKFVAAIYTASSAMFAEAIHSIVDCGNGILILVGIRKSKAAPDHNHPFGRGKELYFYTLIVALLIFLLGGCIAIYKGVTTIALSLNGVNEAENLFVNYIVLGLGMIFEGSSLFVAVRQFNRARGEMGPFEFIGYAKDPSLYTVVLEDSAAEIGLLFAFLGTLATQLTGSCVFDGAGSLCIGLLLCCVSYVLLRETKGLLVGEGVSAEEIDDMRAAICADDAVIECGEILTMYLGPEDLVVVANVTINTRLNTSGVDIVTDGIETRIKTRWPEAKHVFIEVESLAETMTEHMQQEQWEE